MRLLFIVLALASLLAGAQHPAAGAPSDAPSTAPPAQGAAAQMTVRAGFDGLGKVSGWMPIEIEVRNDGPDIDGELQVVVTDTNTGRGGTYTRAPAVYTAPAILPRRSHKRIMLEAELRPTSQKILARLVEGEAIIAEQDVQLGRVAAGDLLCGVLSRSGPAFDFLPSLELPPPLRRARLAHLEVADLPTRPQLLASLDCLIFDNIATSGLLDVQKHALSSWVASGGLLVVIGGPTWQKTVGGLPPGLLPVEVTGMTGLPSVQALADFGRQPIDGAGPWLVSQATVTDGSAVVDQDGVPLIAAGRRGSGTVLYLAVDPTAEPLRSWPGTPHLWRYVLAHGAGGVGLNSSVTSTFAGWGRIPRNALVDIAPLGTPTPGLLIAFLALYAIVVGPVNYLFLKRFGRPGWSIVTIPVITGLAAVGTFTLANAVRESDVILNKVSLIRGSQEAPAYGRTYVSLLTRQPAAYDVRASETSLIGSLFFPFPRDPALDSQGWSLRVEDGPAPRVSRMQLAGGTLGTFSVDSQLAPVGRIDSDLRVEGRQIAGTVTNGLGATLQDAVIILDYQVVARLGDLKAGETVRIGDTQDAASRGVSSAPLNVAAAAGFGPPTSFSSQLYPSPYFSGGRRATDAARRDILDSVFGSGFNYARLDLAGPTILGWLDKGVVPLEMADVRPAVVETSLFISPLALGVPKGFEGELLAPSIVRRQLGTATLNRQQFGSLDLASGESIAFQFSLPVSNGKFLIDGILVNLDGRFRGVSGGGPSLGEVSLYNWQLTEWEDRIVGFGRNLVSDASPYVSATGDVRVRYTFKPPPDSGITGVSFSRFDVTASGFMR
ncbi:MAG: hypothetical protein M3O34_05485 [Chloroflexota bacterium]|nr:hypothetical protein [Chloroflexota bacterium]